MARSISDPPLDPPAQRTADPLLDDLDESQRAAVTSGAAPLAVVAPAGSGKTRVLTRRIAWRVRERLADPAHVLAVTFTRKAAGELRRRLRHLGVGDRVTAGTFHALGLAQLRWRAAEHGREAPGVLDRKATLLDRLVDDGSSLAPLAAEIDWAKARLVGPAAYAAAARAAQRRPGRPLSWVAEMYGRYEAEKRKRRLVDFDDLLGFCADAIETDTDFAAAQRWRFRHLFVDEFQDVNPLQLRLLSAWLGGRDDLTVVGDDAQAIYGFAGADAAPLTGFASHFPGGETLRLSLNYRSTPQIVAASTAMFDPAAATHATHAVSAARAVRGDGATACVTAYDDEKAEARGVARVLLDARLSGLRFGDMAVLFRTNAQASVIVEALRRAGVACRVVGAAPTDTVTRRAVVDALRKAQRRTPGRAFADHLADLAALVAGDDVLADPSDDPPDSAPPTGPAHREAAADLWRRGRDYVATEAPGTLEGFLSWLSLTDDPDDPHDPHGAHGAHGAHRAHRTHGADGPSTASGADAVDLLTFHRAKGLEWHLVCVTGVEAGLVPISHATTPPAQDEERRLLHVALGRAGGRLHVSWARARSGHGRRPSPWLDAVARAAPPGPADRVPDPRLALAELQAALTARPRPEPLSRRARGRPRG